MELSGAYFPLESITPTMAWLAFRVAFIAYPHPRMTVVVFVLLLAFAAFTA